MNTRILGAAFHFPKSNCDASGARTIPAQVRAHHLLLKTRREGTPVISSLPRKLEDAMAHAPGERAMVAGNDEDEHIPVTLATGAGQDFERGSSGTRAALTGARVQGESIAPARLVCFDKGQT